MLRWACGGLLALAIVLMAQAWPAAPGGTGLVLRRTPVVDDYAITARDCVLAARAGHDITVTLPLATTVYGRVYVIANETDTGAALVTVAAQTGERIGGRVTWTLGRDATLTAQSNGHGWTIISAFAPMTTAAGR